MELRVRTEEGIRVIGDHKNDNIVDVNGVGYDSLAIDLYPRFYYIEIRKKEDQIRVFTFPKKSSKKDCDFGWWKDADVILAVNDRISN